jgi:hypothetical protein
MALQWSQHTGPWRSYRGWLHTYCVIVKGQEEPELLRPLWDYKREEWHNRPGRVVYSHVLYQSRRPATPNNYVCISRTGLQVLTITSVLVPQTCNSYHVCISRTGLQLLSSVSVAQACNSYHVCISPTGLQLLSRLYLSHRPTTPITSVSVPQACSSYHVCISPTGLQLLSRLYQSHRTATPNNHVKGRTQALHPRSKCFMHVNRSFSEPSGLLKLKRILSFLRVFKSSAYVTDLTTVKL